MELLTNHDTKVALTMDQLYQLVIKVVADTRQLVNIEDLPDLSAGDAARFLGCSITHLHNLIRRHPEIVKPILANKKQKRYRTAELLRLKNSGKVK